MLPFRLQGAEKITAPLSLQWPGWQPLLHSGFVAGSTKITIGCKQGVKERTKGWAVREGAARGHRRGPHDKVEELQSLLKATHPSLGLETVIV